MKNKPFLASLFDLSFTSFITGTWIKTIYLIAIVLHSWVLFAGLFAFALLKGVYGVFVMFFAVLLYISLLTVQRISLEIVIVAFRNEEHTRLLAFKARQDMGMPQ